MPFDGSGGFIRNQNWTRDASTGVKILSSLHDDEDNNFRDGLGRVICKDGQSTVEADIPFNGHRITGLGAGVNPGDAVSLSQLTSVRNFSTSITLTGGFLGAAPTKTSQAALGFGPIHMAWIARDDGSPAGTPIRVALNNNWGWSGVPTDPGTDTGTAGDVLFVDQAGRINNSGDISNNLAVVGAAWNVIATGFGTLLRFTGGAIRAFTHDASVNAGLAATLRNFWSVANSGGSVTMSLDNSTGAFASQIGGTKNGVQRWLMQLGDGAAESGSNAGSNFGLHAYSDGGGYLGGVMTAVRATLAVTFGGSITSGNVITSANHFLGTGVYASSTGAMYFRPNGINSTVEQITINSGGDLVVSNVGGIQAGYGIKERFGQTGTIPSPANWMNLAYNGGADTRVYADNVHVGTVPAPCDYRIKQDVASLPSTWDAVKALRPISFVYAPEMRGRAGDGRPHWGFIAHELQDVLPTLATGQKDMEGGFQSPDIMGMVAALTAALQEAQARIEALEAA